MFRWIDICDSGFIKMSIGRSKYIVELKAVENQLKTKFAQTLTSSIL